MIMKTSLVVLLLVATGVRSGPTRGPRPPVIKNLVSVEINIGLNQTFFNGMPAYVTFTITNTQNKPFQIPEWNALQSHLPVSIELTDPNGRIYDSRVDNQGFIAAELHTNTFPVTIPKENWTIEPNENRRCIANLGPKIDMLKVPAGKYKMRICVWEDIERIDGCSNPIMVQIADLKAEDKKSLSENLEVSPYGSGIDKIKRTITPSVIKSIPTKELREQLAFNIIIDVLASRKELSETKINGYENLVAPYLSDDIELFKYEILLTKKDKDNAAQAKKSLTAKGHSMDYWLKQADDGKGYIKILKSMGVENIEKYSKLIDTNSPD
jgi:hypothetical protein